VRRYTERDEERLHLLRSVKSWTRSGLLGRDQGAQLEADLQVDLRRTGIMLRVGIALFTVILVVAAVALTILSVRIDRDWAIGIVALFSGAICFGVADWLVGEFKLYRYGVEEALLVSSVALLGAGVGLIAASVLHTHGNVPIDIALVAAAAASGYAYHRFGLQYAGVAAIVCLGLIPLLFDGGSEPVRRSLVALIFLVAAAVAAVMAARATNEIRKDDAFVFRAAAVVGLYLVVNLEIASGPFNRYGHPIQAWFKWTTYALIWIVPALALWRGIASRDRKLIVVGIGLALITLITNKPYLGLPRQTWDPMLFGLLLAGIAVVLRRWLASGPGGERHGFTGERILHSDVDALRVVGVASAAIHLQTDRPAPEPTPASPQFGGGRSGGAGAGGDF